MKIGIWMGLVITALLLGCANPLTQTMEQSRVDLTLLILSQVDGNLQISILKDSVPPVTLEAVGPRGLPPMDAWDRPFVYKVPGTDGRAYDLISLGRDGKVGGEGFDADLMLDRDE